jgi:hypothetical protein
MSKKSNSNSNKEKQLLPIGFLVFILLFLGLPFILYNSLNKQKFQNISKENNNEYLYSK